MLFKYTQNIIIFLHYSIYRLELCVLVCFKFVLKKLTPKIRNYSDYNYDIILLGEIYVHT